MEPIAGGGSYYRQGLPQLAIRNRLKKGSDLAIRSFDSDDELSGVAAELALGLASEEDGRRLLELVEEGDEQACAELAAFEETAAAIGLLAPPANPPPGLRGKLLQAISSKPFPKPLPGFREEVPGFQVLRSGAGVWRKTPFEGVETMLLSMQRGSDIVTILMRMAPGSRYPAHRHDAEEQCWVLEGDVSHADGAVRMTAGDFVRAMPGTEHVPITTEGGCLLLLVASAKNEMIG